jgi:hypothetical protein
VEKFDNFPDSSPECLSYSSNERGRIVTTVTEKPDNRARLEVPTGYCGDYYPVDIIIIRRQKHYYLNIFKLYFRFLWYSPEVCHGCHVTSTAHPQQASLRNLQEHL